MAVSNLVLVGKQCQEKHDWLTHLAKEEKKKHPEMKIFLMGSGNHYSNVFDVQIKLITGNSSFCEIVSNFESARDYFYEYARDNAGALLVIDEYTLLATVMRHEKQDYLRQMLMYITSIGHSAGINVWISASSDKTCDLNLNRSFLSQMKVLQAPARTLTSKQ